jgi:hypothetical protein
MAKKESPSKRAVKPQQESTAKDPEPAKVLVKDPEPKAPVKDPEPAKVLVKDPEPAKVLVKDPEPVAPKEGPPCTFARWFRSKNFKPHWQSGMEASRDTSGKKTPEEWDRIFKGY